MNKLPKRKQLRLKNYNYLQPGYYFITICTHKRRKLLSNIEDGDGSFETPKLKLTPLGKEIVKTLEYIDNHYPNVTIDKYVLMPNHIHLIVILQQPQPGSKNLSLHKVIGQFKSYTNKIYNELNGTKNLILWQRNYYERVIRGEEEYLKLCEYIQNNPIKWQEDEYFV